MKSKQVLELLWPNMRSTEQAELATNSDRMLSQCSNGKPVEERRQLSPLPRRANNLPRNRSVSTYHTAAGGHKFSRSESLRDMDHLAKVQQAATSVANAPWYILQPESGLMVAWGVFTALILVFTVLVTPYEQAFLEPQLNELFVINRLVDLTFIIDMCIQFLTMYRPRNGGSEQTEALSQWEHRLRPIASRYLKGWFAVDVLSVFPCIFDIVALVDGSATAPSNPELKLVRLLCRFPRIARLKKIMRFVVGSKLLSRVRTRVSIPHMSLSMFSLVFELIVASHWLACILSLQTVYEEKINTWYGSYGWCTLDEEGEQQCQPASQMYLVCLNWAFGIVSGFAKEPAEGPYPQQLRLPDEAGGGKRFSAGEMVRELLWLMISALGRAYITARLVEIFVHANPDLTEFKLQMDELNRYIRFYRLSPEMAQRLREFFYETRITRQAEGRSAIVQQLTTGLQEAVSEQVNEKWLQTVPFFRGLVGPDGKQVVNPVEKSFLAKVAVALQSGVFAPKELPPRGRVYVIVQGTARYRGLARKAGYCWGALDVMLPNAPISVMDVTKSAIAISYLHVLYVDGPTLTRLAKHFPKSRWAMRKWTIITGVREYLLGELRHASDKDRNAARDWIKEEQESKKQQRIGLWKSIGRKQVLLNSFKRPKEPKAPPHARTVPDLHAAMNKRLDAIVAVLELQRVAAIAQERKMAAIQQALEPLLPSTAAARGSQPTTPYQKPRTRKGSKESMSKSRLDSSDPGTSDPGTDNPTPSSLWGTSTRGADRLRSTSMDSVVSIAQPAGNTGPTRSASVDNVPSPAATAVFDC